VQNSVGSTRKHDQQELYTVRNCIAVGSMYNQGGRLWLQAKTLTLQTPTLYPWLSHQVSHWSLSYKSQQRGCNC